MAIEDIEFLDGDKKIEIIIDGKPQEIPIKIIQKKSTTITINQLNNTALREDIIVDATLSPVKKGILTISLWDLEKKILYYATNVSSNDGHFRCRIPNDVRIGKYIVTLEYAGNKYYERYSIDKQIEIQHRELLCDLDAHTFYVKPGDTFTKSFKLIDKINNQYISDCQISYLYKDETFNIVSDSDGNINLEIQVPNPDKSHCNTNSYSLKNTTIKLFIKKINTQTSAHQVNDEYGQYIQGDIITDDGYANYGTAEISILKTYTQEAEVDVNGFFKTDKILVTDIMDSLTSDSDGRFKSDIDIPTVLTAKGDTPIKVGEEIHVTATVVDNKENKVVDGTVDFKMYNSKEKLVYRYIDELDESGQVLFIFYTSKPDVYRIETTYNSVITYKSSQAEDIVITVGE